MKKLFDAHKKDVLPDEQASVIVPQGCARWTLQLLADKSVELKYIDSITDMSVHRLLKKHNFRASSALDIQPHKRHGKD